MLAYVISLSYFCDALILKIIFYRKSIYIDIIKESPLLFHTPFPQPLFRASAGIVDMTGEWLDALEEEGVDGV